MFRNKKEPLSFMFPPMKYIASPNLLAEFDPRRGQEEGWIIWNRSELLRDNKDSGCFYTDTEENCRNLMRYMEGGGTVKIVELGLEEKS